MSSLMTDLAPASPTDDRIKVSTDLSDENVDFAWPTVVAVVATHNPGDWLEKCLSSLAAEDYPDLTTLVVDVRSEKPINDRVAAVIPTAFVRTVDSTDNFAEAINVAINSIEGATYVLVCHDDIVLEPGAIAHLVEEAFRSNASIIGPKIIDADNPDQLLEVGALIDHFGVPFTGIEHDEVDQGQHDGVRDVFFVSSAAMLVRADLFRALGGFDVKCFPGAEDIDLAWRAHLVNARVLVQPDAVVRHHKASDRQRKSRTSARATVAKHRMRMVLKNASFWSLAWIIPAAIVLHIIEGAAWLLRADPRRAYFLATGWIWNIRHLSDTRKERKKIQETREVSDRVVSTYQIGGSSRVRRFFASISHNRQLRKFTMASRLFASTKYSQRTSETPLYCAAVIVYLLAIRSFIFNGINTIGEFVSWPSMSDQTRALFHGSLPVGSHSSLASTFGRVLVFAASFICFGHPALAQTIVVAALIPIGCIGVRAILNNLALRQRSVTLAVIAYGSCQLTLAVFSHASFSGLVALATIPYIMRSLARLRIRQGAIAASVFVAFVPSALTILLAIGVVYVLIGSQKDFRESKTLQGLAKRTEVIGATIAVALLTNIGIVIDATRGIDRNMFGFDRVSGDFSQYFFSSDLARFSLFVTAAIVACALIGTRTERTKEIRVLLLSVSLLVGYSIFATRLAWALIDPFIIYSLAALAFALSVGLCINSYTDEMRQRDFGVFHLVNTVSVVAALCVCLASLVALGKGSMLVPSRDWSNQIETVHNSRVLYVGNESTLPGNGVSAPFDRNFLVSASPRVTTSARFVGPGSTYDHQVAEVLSAVFNRKTSHAGILLNRLSIGEIVVPLSLAPGTKSTVTDNELIAALDQQSDLIRLQNREGLVEYKNAAFANGYAPTSYVSHQSVLSTLTNRVQGNTRELSSLPLAIFSVGMGVAVLLFFLFGPRRSQLISYTSLSLSKATSAPHEKKELDLVHEHQQDEKPKIPEDNKDQHEHEVIS
jgi:GT2 family glycosyltransferase